MSINHYEDCLASETGLNTPVICFGDAKWLHKQHLKQVHPDKRGGSHEKFIKARGAWEKLMKIYPNPTDEMLIVIDCDCKRRRNLARIERERQMRMEAWFQPYATDLEKELILDYQQSGLLKPGDIPSHPILVVDHQMGDTFFHPIVVE